MFLQKARGNRQNRGHDFMSALKIVIKTESKFPKWQTNLKVTLISKH